MLEAWHQLPTAVNDGIIIVGGMVVFGIYGYVMHLRDKRKTK